MNTARIKPASPWERAYAFLMGLLIGIMLMTIWALYAISEPVPPTLPALIKHGDRTFYYRPSQGGPQ